jgi:hypothetical protein
LRQTGRIDSWPWRRRQSPCRCADSTLPLACASGLCSVALRWGWARSVEKPSPTDRDSLWAPMVVSTVTIIPRQLTCSPPVSCRGITNVRNLLQSDTAKQFQAPGSCGSTPLMSSGPGRPRVLAGSVDPRLLGKVDDGSLVLTQGRHSIPQCFREGGEQRRHAGVPRFFMR